MQRLGLRPPTNAEKRAGSGCREVSVRCGLQRAERDFGRLEWGSTDPVEERARGRPWEPRSRILHWSRSLRVPVFPQLHPRRTWWPAAGCCLARVLGPSGARRRQAGHGGGARLCLRPLAQSATGCVVPSSPHLPEVEFFVWGRVRRRLRLPSDPRVVPRVQ